MTKRIFHGAILVFGFLLLWTLLVIVLHLPNYILPSPLEVLQIIHTRSFILFHATLITFTEALLGLLLGIIFGALCALLMASVSVISLWLLPILIISQALPTFAIAPLLVMWFGFGMTSKIITIMLMIFFPITSGFYDGLTKPASDWMDLAKNMNAKTWQIFWYIRMPLALPSLASGIRLAAIAAPMGAIIGEWVGASDGLGYLMLNANARMQIDFMFAALLMIIWMSLFLYVVVDKVLKKIIFWE